MLRRFVGDERGSIAILFAFSVLLGSIAAALAIDEASLYLERRHMQTLVDLASIAAARDPDNAFDIAYGALLEAGAIPAGVTIEEVRDGTKQVRLRVEKGGYRPDRSLAPSARFDTAQQPANAVRITYRFVGRLFFAAGWGRAPDISVTATAAMHPVVAFSVGSRLASLSGGTANAVLNQLLGSNVALTLADYNALAGAHVDLFAFANALANRLDITAGTYNDLLAAQATHGDIAAALAASLNGTAATAAQVIANATGHNGSFAVGRLLDLGALGGLSLGGSAEQALFADVDALEILSAAAALGNGTHQATMALSLGLPGVAGVSLEAVVGEQPQSATWLALDTRGGIARTAQARLRLTIELLGSPLLLGARLRVPVYVEVAYAEARVTALRCPTQRDPNGSATIAARPGIARLAVGSIGSMTDFSGPASVTSTQLARALLLTVDGRALVEMAATTPVGLSFSSSEIEARTVKTAATQTPVQSLTSSLLDNLVIDVSGLSLGAASSAIRTLLTPLAPTIDAVAANVLETLGVRLGEADVRVYGVTCTNPVLVG